MARASPKASRKRRSPAALSLRGLAKRLRVSETAVRKAIRSGRLRESVARDTHGPYVPDLALARREWFAGATKPTNGGGRREPPPTNGAGSAPGPDASDASTLVQAQLRVAAQRATALELANMRKRGELLDAATVQREYFEVARMLRERILNVADRIIDLGPAVRDRVRAELRQALGDIADEIERE